MNHSDKIWVDRQIMTLRAQDHKEFNGPNGTYQVFEERSWLDKLGVMDDLDLNEQYYFGG